MYQMGEEQETGYGKEHCVLTRKVTSTVTKGREYLHRFVWVPENSNAEVKKDRGGISGNKPVQGGTTGQLSHSTVKY